MSEEPTKRELLEAAAKRAAQQQPDTIRLIHAAGHVWSDPAAIEAHAAAMRTLGFTEAGIYTVDVLPVAIRFMLHEQEQMYATIYEHPKAGVWINFIVLYQLGPSITFTNTQDRGLEQRPGHPVVYAFGAAADKLFELATSQAPAGQRKSLTIASIIEEFERAWAEGVSWRKNKGISLAEVASVMLSRDGRDARYLRPDRIHFIVEQDGPPERVLKERWVTVFNQHQSVGRAYLVYLMYDQSPTGSVALCLASASATDLELVAAIRKIFPTVFQKGTNLDILFLSPSEVPRIEAVCKPFYIRTSH